MGLRGLGALLTVHDFGMTRTRRARSKERISLELATVLPHKFRIFVAESDGNGRLSPEQGGLSDSPGGHRSRQSRVREPAPYTA